MIMSPQSSFRSRSAFSLAVIAVSVAFFAASPAVGAVTPAGIFSDSMVLQRGIRTPIWGWATVGEQITVTFNGQTVTATARDSTISAYKGFWKTSFSPMTAGGPFDMTITGSASAAITLKNILVGDVWICSGQSNMWYTFNGMYFTDNSAEGLAIPSDAQPLTQMRMCQIGTSWSTSPALDIQQINTWANQDQRVSAPWRSGTRAVVKDYSAAAGIFGTAICQKTQVPIGLITAAVGGTSLKQYVSAELSDTIVWYQCGNRPDTTIAKRTPVRFGGGANSVTDGGVFSGEISPLIGLGIKGVIFWQGENEAGGFDPVCYYTSGGFRQLVREWRRKWGQGDFPFIYIQLQQSIDSYTTAAINDVRDQQMQVLGEPNTGMATIFDSCSGMHPGKAIPALRLALVARAVAYGENIEYMGPIYNGMTIEGSTIRIKYAHVGGGLVKKALCWFEGDNNLAVGANALSSSSDAAAPFEIAGSDKVYHRADAVLSTSNTVVVSAPGVTAPQYVRYAIELPSRAKTPLYNSNNLAASMFRTETWGGLNTATLLDNSMKGTARGTHAAMRVYKVTNGRITLPGPEGRAKTIDVYDVRGVLLGRMVTAGDAVLLNRRLCGNQLVMARVR
jgi:sialate O-acetylesterase